MVWSKTKEVLAKPEIILRQLTEASNTGELNTIEAEIKELQRQLRTYDRRKSNLLEAIELGEFTKDEILDRLNSLKQQRAETEARLETLRKAKDSITGLANATIKFNELYQRVLDNLENATSEIKRLAFDALDIKVYASKNNIEIKGVVPLKLALPTTAQTLA